MQHKTQIHSLPLEVFRYCLFESLSLRDLINLAKTSSNMNEVISAITKDTYWLLHKILSTPSVDLSYIIHHLFRPASHERYQAIKSQALDSNNNPEAFICYALITENVMELDQNKMLHTIDWLKREENPFAKFVNTLTAIHAIQNGDKDLFCKVCRIPDMYFNFAGADLAEKFNQDWENKHDKSYYSGLKLDGANFEKTSLGVAFFKSCTFCYCDFSYSNLINTEFKACKMNNLKADNANFTNCDFNDSLLQRSIFSNSTFQSTLSSSTSNFTDSNFESADIVRSPEILKGDFSNANLARLRFFNLEIIHDIEKFSTALLRLFNINIPNLKYVRKAIINDLVAALNDNRSANLTMNEKHERLQIAFEHHLFKQHRHLISFLAHHASLYFFKMPLLTTSQRTIKKIDTVLNNNVP